MENDLITYIRNNSDIELSFNKESTEINFKNYFNGIITDDYTAIKIHKSAKELLIFDNESTHYLMIDQHCSPMTLFSKGFFSYATSIGKTKDGRDYSTALMYYKPEAGFLEEMDNKWNFYVQLRDEEKGLYLLDYSILFNRLELYHYDKNKIKMYEILNDPLNSYDYLEKDFYHGHPVYQELKTAGIEPNHNITILDNINENKIDELVDIALLCRNDSESFIEIMNQEIQNSYSNNFEYLKSQIKDTVESNTKTKLLTLKTKIHK